MEQRHPSLPQMLSAAELQQWIIKASVERFKDKTKRYFSQEEVASFEHESSKNGRHKNKLEGILAHVTGLIRNGNDQELIITIPETIGTKNCDKFRKQNDDLIETGFEEVECEVFGIVNTREELMEYFMLDGSIISERTRPLSIREKQQYLLVRQIVPGGSGARLSIEEGAERTGTDN